MPMPTHPSTSRYLPARAVASGRFLPGVLDELAELLGTGRIGRIGELGPLEDGVEGGLQAIRVASEVAKTAQPAAERLDPRADLVGLDSECVGQRGDLLGSAGPHRLHGAGEPRRVGLRAGRPDDTDERLADAVTGGRARRSDRETRQ